MFWSENFHFKPFMDSRAKTQIEREREREPSTLTSPTSPITAFNFDFANLQTHRSTNRSRLRLRWSTNRSTNPWTDLRPTNHRLRRQPKTFVPRTDLRPRTFDPRAFNFVDDPEPLRHEPTNRSLSLCDFDFLCDFDWPTNWSTFLCDFDFLLSLFDLWFFFFFFWLWWCGWWCFGGFPVVWWWVLCGWW